jgi:1-acyl-sn-glycerol-3-phosphate acyltransferase
MSQLYHVLRRVISFGLDLYFVDIQSHGVENVPKWGPVIFAANHPNSIMDTMILGFCSERQVHYMARSGLFEHLPLKFIFDRCGVIPVYRSQDGTDKSKNASSFEAAFELLEGGKVLGIFPEGRNSQEWRVIDIKTGTARIALGVEARNDFDLGVRVVPVGLNYQDRDRFLTSVLLRFGEPIDVRKWKEQYEGDDREAVRDLTRTIQQGIEAQTLHVENVVVWEMARALARIAERSYISELVEEREEFGELVRKSESRRKSFTKGVINRMRFVDRAPQLSERFDSEQLLSDALMHELETKPLAFAELRASVRQYEDHRAQVRLRHDFAARHPATLSSRKEGAKLTFYALLVGPFAIWGFVHNVLPYQLVKVAAKRAPDEAIRAMTAFVFGTLFFLSWYGLIGWGLWVWNEESLVEASVYVSSMPLTGFIFLRYRKRVAGWRDKILARTLFRTQQNLVNTLFDERERLSERVAMLLDDYLAERPERLEELGVSGLEEE